MREAAASTTEIAWIFSPRRTEYGLDAVRAHNGRLARAVASSEARGGATPFGRNIDERFRAGNEQAGHETARSRYFRNRGGRNLSATRRAELERAKRILQRRAAARKCTTKKR